MSGTVVLVLRIFLLLSLYAFLGWALYTLWQDLRSQGKMISSPHIPPLTLTPLDGFDVEGHTFKRAEVIVGRSTSSEYIINNEMVSARHARFSYHHNQWWLEDLNSTNGTFLNDERVSTATVIVSGDEVYIGQVGLKINLEDKNN